MLGSMQPSMVLSVIGGLLQLSLTAQYAVVYVCQGKAISFVCYAVSD